MKVLRSFLFALLFLGLGSCTEEDLNNILNPGGLSDSEIAQGLREALVVGTDTSVAQLNRPGGYLNDLAVKILLPPALQQNIADLKATNINLGITSISGEQLYNGTTVFGITIPGLRSKEDELIEGINRAAEQAAGTAAPIFVNAITDISISDANDILFGGVDTAATAYLRQNTYGNLFNLYEPQMENALQQVKIGNTSVVDSYEDFVGDYNQLLNTSIPGFGSIASLAGLQPVGATDLSAYGTGKGLDGLFLKIAEEEEDIRRDPLARVSDLLARVFGQLD